MKEAPRRRGVRGDGVSVLADGQSSAPGATLAAMGTKIEIPPNPPGDRLAAIVPRRLAATREAAPFPPDEAHHHAHQQAIDWQVMAADAQRWELGPAEEDRGYELVGRMASTGEQLALGLAAESEVETWRLVRQESEFDAEHEMCMRAMAEAQCLFVIGTGHALANVALRALALDSKLRAALIKRFSTKNSSPTFAVFSEQRADSVPMDRTTCKRLRSVARASGDPEVVKLIEPVVEVRRGAAWQKLVDRRGGDFHRWRPQTYGIESVPRTSPWTHEGDTRILRFGRLSDEAARGRAEDTASLATSAMLELARAMELFKAQLYLASRRLGGPRFGAAPEA
jgi:hypothetical protein